MSSGYQISQAIGNNAISYEQRMAHGSAGKLRVPPMISGTLNDVKLGSEIVFEEVEDGKLTSCTGLEAHVLCSYLGRPLFITDNHNHVLIWWARWKYEFQCKQLVVIHIDQHADLSQTLIGPGTLDRTDQGAVTKYVQQCTTIASFIQPALEGGLIQECRQVRSSSALLDLNNFHSKIPYVLDIDLDFRSPEAGYSDNELETHFAIIRKLAENAVGMSVATSPYFIDQHRALELIHKIFG